MTALWIPRVLLSFSSANCKSLLGKVKSAALTCSNQSLSPRPREAPRAAVQAILSQHRIAVHCCESEIRSAWFKGNWLPGRGWVRWEKETRADKKSTASE